LTQCLLREPVAIAVEMSGVSVTDPVAANTFSMILRQADLWPGTPVLLCAPDATTASMITSGSSEPVPLFATVAAALAVLTGHDAVIREHIPPVRGAARHARDIVTDACLRWDLPHLTAATTVVVSELVTNAVVHAGTAMTLQARLRARYLYLAVSDGSHAEPVPRPHHPGTPGGRGLHMVELLSARWGYQRQHDGKVVWASFATALAH
jgi:anti-sigma regulatory factor (Ser/Thr protein kinase)